jgi:hypothetical protein
MDQVYGFRGNARNYDLNRDFIKSDTRNTKSFVEIFHTINADVFIDNHVSNGSDYQYKLTYIDAQHNKLGTVLEIFKFRNDAALVRSTKKEHRNLLMSMLLVIHLIKVLVNF